LFSWSYVSLGLKFILRYPSVIPKVFEGSSKVWSEVDRLRKNKWLKNPVNIKCVDGFKIYLNTFDTEGPSVNIGIDGYWELSETQMLKQVLKKGMTFVDAGANVGWYTLLAARLVGKSGRVIGFEPEPKCYRLLEKSVKENGFENVHLHNCILSDTEGKAQLWLAPNNLGAHSLTRMEDAARLDSVVHGHVDVLKVDVEGHEPQVIKGAISLFENGCIDRVFLEYDPRVWHDRSFFEDYEIFEFVMSPFLIRKVENLSEVKHKTDLLLKRVRVVNHVHKVQRTSDRRS